MWIRFVFDVFEYSILPKWDYFKYDALYFASILSTVANENLFPYVLWDNIYNYIVFHVHKVTQLIWTIKEIWKVPILNYYVSEADILIC